MSEAINSNLKKPEPLNKIRGGVESFDITPSQNAIRNIPKIQEIMRELQKYNSKLAIYIPHYHPPNSDINFAILPIDLVQVRNGNIITFERKNKIENNKDFQPSGYTYKNGINIASYEKSKMELFDITKIKDIENILSFLSEYNLGITLVNRNINYEKYIEVEEPFGNNQIIKLQEKIKYSGKVADSTVIFIGNNLEAARCCDPQRLNGHIQKKH